MSVDDPTVSKTRPTKFVAALCTSHMIARIRVGFLREGLASWTHLPPVLTSQGFELDSRVPNETDLVRLAARQRVFHGSSLLHCVFATDAGMSTTSAIPAKVVLAARTRAAILATLSVLVGVEKAAAFWAHLDTWVRPHCGPQVKLVVFRLQKAASDQWIHFLAARHVETSWHLACSDLRASTASRAVSTTSMHSAERLQNRRLKIAEAHWASARVQICAARRRTFAISTGVWKADRGG